MCNVRLPAASGSVTDYEDECYGINHARIGCEVAKTWLLPEEVCQAVLWHHQYAAMQDGSAGMGADGAKNIALALAAESVCVKQKMGTHSAEWRKGAPFALAVLGLEQADLDAAGAQAAQECKLF